MLECMSGNLVTRKNDVKEEKHPFCIWSKYARNMLKYLKLDKMNNRFHTDTKEID